MVAGGLLEAHVPACRGMGVAGDGEAFLLEPVVQGQNGLRRLGQTGGAVDAAFLESHPVGAQVAFLEDPDAQAVRLGQIDGVEVERAPVALEDDVGGAEALVEAGDEGRPGFAGGLPAAVADGVGLGGPEEVVAPADVDLADKAAGLFDGAAEGVEEGALRALQEEEGSGHELSFLRQPSTQARRRA